MRSQPHSLEREKIIAEAIGGLVAELRLVDPLDYAAFLRLDLHGNLADIVQSAAELYFAPGFIELGQGGQASLSWGAPPEIDLDLVMRPAGVAIHFLLRLKAEAAEVRLAYISFDDPSDDPAANTRFMREAIAKYRLGKPSADKARPEEATRRMFG
ncbi:MAG: hypothetical protein R3D45_10655 [Rhizobiaceae bacterium]